jgi:hypothetical protein
MTCLLPDSCVRPQCRCDSFVPSDGRRGNSRRGVRMAALATIIEQHGLLVVWAIDYKKLVLETAQGYRFQTNLGRKVLQGAARAGLVDLFVLPGGVLVVRRDAQNASLRDT